jgi:multicomponent K+:H+ antiporter subunit A
MTLAWIVALPFAAALVLLALPNERRDAAALVAGVATLAAGALLWTQAGAVASGLVVRHGWPWLPLPGADFGFRLDGLASLFALLVIGIGALVILYARYYLSSGDPIARFYAFFMLFMGAMLGVVLAGNLVVLVVFWELTSIASFLLIGYWQGRDEARQGARMALTVTGAGGLCLLAGALLLGRMAGSYDLDVVLAAGDAIRADRLYAPMLLLVLAGAFAKSAQFPLHFWLPHAMAAPTPVSAYLHSATMVKAGVFLLARLHPAIAGTELWFDVVTTVGAVTLLVGAYVAVFQHDLKGLLAYSTISHLGLITLLLGLDTPLASVAAVFHILNHATFKASLFMAAGIIDHESGTRDMRRLNGLWRLMPLTAVLAIVASAAMAGVPLMNGFLSKEMFFAETLQISGHDAMRLAVPLVATLAGAFAVAYSTRFIHDVFWNGAPRDLPRTPHDPPAWMLVPVGVLVLACLLVGMLPGPTIGGLLALGARDVIAGPLPAYSLAVWHGLNLPLLMSMLALAIGAAFYFSLQKLFNLHDTVHLPRGGKEIFDAVLGAALGAAGRLSRGVADGRLQRSLLPIAAIAVVALGWPLVAGGLGGAAAATPAPLLGVLVFAIGAVGAIGVVALHHRRFVALVFLGATGLAVSLVFALLSAPDLALTQLLVEVASVLLLMLALQWLPQAAPPERGRWRRLRDAAIALTAGLVTALAAWAVLTRPPVPRVPEWLLANSVPGAAGRNAVNTIIVDFRGFDTLGEIAVLGIAALLVLALLTGLHGVRPGSAVDRSRDVRAPLLAVLGLTTIPLAATIAAWFFVRGHNEPGGGFIAGLTLALGLLVAWVGRGGEWAEGRLRSRFESWIGWGLALAITTGLGSFLLGYPFLTSTYLAPQLPLVGKVSIATAMFFDLGVFAVVTGATMALLRAIGRLTDPDAPRSQPWS